MNEESRDGVKRIEKQVVFKGESWRVWNIQRSQDWLELK